MITWITLALLCWSLLQCLINTSLRYQLSMEASTQRRLSRLHSPLEGTPICGHLSYDFDCHQVQAHYLVVRQQVRIHIEHLQLHKIRPAICH